MKSRVQLSKEVATDTLCYCNMSESSRNMPQFHIMKVLLCACCESSNKWPLVKLTDISIDNDVQK